ncbi:MAG: radical SAM protein [Clostridia bacterium]|nr:radical SAM protein [Clostridia bacterium]
MLLQTSPYLMVLKDIFNKNKSMVRDFLYNKDHDIRYLSILKDCHTPKDYNQLINCSSKKDIDYLINNKLIISIEDTWKLTNIENVEIEICAHCNWRCEYCPVSTQPKPPKKMSMDLFKQTIDKAVRHKTIKNVTFCFCNEPTLDKFFLERVKYLTTTDLKLRLHTNGSNLSKDMMNYLKETDVLAFVCFNLPSVVQDEFEKMTRYSNLDKVLRNIDYALGIGLPVTFSIQGTKKELEHNLPHIQQRFKEKFNKINSWETFDRAGLLDNRYCQNVNINGKLYGGCNWILNWLNVSVNGECYLCYNDYHQNYVLGNIADGEIEDILLTEKAISLRQYVFGKKEPDKDFICRKCITMKRAKLLSRFIKA